jgi:hypothetical protein
MSFLLWKPNIYHRWEITFRVTFWLGYGASPCRPDGNNGENGGYEAENEGFDIARHFKILLASVLDEYGTRSEVM